MKVWTTRSGVVLHASAKCADLIGKRVFVIEAGDALERAVRCTHGHCNVAFLRAHDRQEAKAA